MSLAIKLDPDVYYDKASLAQLFGTAEIFWAKAMAERGLRGVKVAQRLWFRGSWVENWLARLPSAGGGDLPGEIVRLPGSPIIGVRKEDGTVQYQGCVKPEGEI